nr:MAG TPA: hypothetical protein [Caudoviricetes sp.]DAZ31709.1 MAG TPA: hypothetical protein [Caudoviricetes sp.]
MDTWEKPVKRTLIPAGLLKALLLILQCGMANIHYRCLTVLLIMA